VGPTGTFVRLCRHLHAKILPDDDIWGLEYLWQWVTTVWSPFPPESIPESEVGPDFSPEEAGAFPTQAQLNALGACVSGDYFTYSYLEPDAQLLPSGISDFNAPWFHAQIACYEGELVTYHWVGPTTMYPPGPRS
jgi:hypothetical protein